jgi:hypothetical protein
MLLGNTCNVGGVYLFGSCSIHRSSLMLRGPASIDRLARAATKRRPPTKLTWLGAARRASGLGNGSRAHPRTPDTAARGGKRPVAPNVLRVRGHRPSQFAASCQLVSATTVLIERTCSTRSPINANWCPSARGGTRRCGVPAAAPAPHRSAGLPLRNSPEVVRRLYSPC